MLCEKCKKKEATVIYKETINGQKNSYSLCSDCAAEMGVFDSAKKMMSDPFAEMNSLFGSLFGLAPYQKKQITDEKKCNLCGATFRELAEEGMVGCPNCYSEFADELSATIARIHGSSEHTGASPAEFRNGREKKRQIEDLEKQLREAVEAEEYEKAATIRDRLREIKNEEGGNK